MTVATSSALTAANLNAKLVSRTDDTVVTGKPNFTNGVQVSTETSALTAITRTMDGVELIATSMNATNKYLPAIKGMSKDAQLTTENPKLGTVMVPRCTQTFDGDDDGGMVWDFFITPNTPGVTSVPVYAASVTYMQTTPGLYSEGCLGLKDGITAPSTTSGVASLYVDTADGDLKVRFGDGNVKKIMNDTVGTITFQKEIEYNETTTAQTQSTSAVTVYTKSFAANELGTRGQGFELELSCEVSGTANTKIVSIDLGGINISDFTAAATTTDYLIKVKVVTRTAANLLRCRTEFYQNGVLPVIAVFDMTTIDLSAAADLEIKHRVTNAADRNDIDYFELVTIK